MYRAVTTWNETITRAMRLEEKAHTMTDELKPVVTSAQRIAQDFQELKGDLKIHAESATKIVEGVEAIKAMRQEDQFRFKKLTNEARRRLDYNRSFGRNDSRCGALAVTVVGSLDRFDCHHWLGSRRLALRGQPGPIQWPLLQSQRFLTSIPRLALVNPHSKADVAIAAYTSSPPVRAARRYFPTLFSR